MKRITISVTPAFLHAARTYQEAMGLKSLSAAIERLARDGLRRVSVNVKEERTTWGGPRWEGDTRPLDER
jgi:hypothetical protein